ncbi:hypothetical protein JXC34_02475, partial [Candidatus Woesearchaeota archaeon]|nr:hypothetical protein [Candidatus Woesearchaeota archaeon]
KKATIQTNSYSLEIQYLSGRTQEITLVTREIRLDFEGDIDYVEFIPKDLVDSSDNIVFVTEPDKILNKDPVFETKITDQSEIIYYIKSPVSLDNIPKIKPMIITLKQDESMKGITGFALFDSIGFSESNTKIFVFELLVVFILLGVYLYFNYNSSVISSLFPPGRTIKPSPDARTLPIEKKTRPVAILPARRIDGNHRVSYMRTLISKVNSLIKFDKLKDAALHYHELKFLYQLLGRQDQESLFGEVIAISDSIISKHIGEMINEAVVAIALGDDDEAFRLYQDIDGEFSKLSVPYKEKLYSRCCELALHLNRHETKHEKEN